MKKFLATACAAVMTASMLVMSASAGVGDIKYEIKGTNKAPVMDGKVTQDEYAGNAPIVLDGKGKNTDAGGWGDTLMGKASLVCLGSLVAESLLLYRFHLGMDYAAQFSLIPLTYFLLRWLLSLRFAERKRYRYLRKASILIFTIHYGVMELLRSLFSDAAWYTESTTVQYVFVLAVTLLLTAAILYLSEHVRGCGWLRVLY